MWNYYSHRTSKRRCTNTLNSPYPLFQHFHYSQLHTNTKNGNALLLLHCQEQQIFTVDIHWPLKNSEIDLAASAINAREAANIYTLKDTFWHDPGIQTLCTKLYRSNRDWRKQHFPFVSIDINSSWSTMLIKRKIIALYTFFVVHKFSFVL